ncbi:MAG: trehalose-6-phosphate synthase [Gemmatimonadales bacterium]|nr:MAG: trehalose-6-phosphate synthase [Gemmatimonadales bacterium]
MANVDDEVPDPSPEAAPPSRMVVVSNRLPVVLTPVDEEGWTVEPGAGGLVTALEPVLQRIAGTWVGWPGVDVRQVEEVQELLDRGSGDRGFEVRAIGLSPEEEERFYLGFANQVIWPLFHGFPERCRFQEEFWDCYLDVNGRFADGIVDELEGEDLIWVHDYHLMGVAKALRERGVRQPICFFLHTPMPTLDVFRKLPWRLALLESLLEHDLVGFHTERDRENFLHAVRCLLPDEAVEREGSLVRVGDGSRTARVGVFPISIDAREFAETAATEGVRLHALRLRQALPGFVDEDPDSHLMLLGVDRLDYTKGLPQKLRAYQTMLRRHPEMLGRVTLVQLVVPSREDIPLYEALKDEVDQLVGEISGEFSQENWSPIRYEYGQWAREKLLAHYRAARVALVTPLQDGMNLVSKEFCASSVDGDGVLVLSEHAGSASQLHSGAILVNPYHEEELAEAMHRACTMGAAERKRRMSKLRQIVASQDIHWWTDSFLKAARGDRSRRERRWPRPQASRSDPVVGLSPLARGLRSHSAPGEPGAAAPGGGDDEPEGSGGPSTLPFRLGTSGTRAGDGHGYE